MVISSTWVDLDLLDFDNFLLRTEREFDAKALWNTEAMMRVGIIVETIFIVIPSGLGRKEGL